MVRKGIGQGGVIAVEDGNGSTRADDACHFSQHREGCGDVTYQRVGDDDVETRVGKIRRVRIADLKGDPVADVFVLREPVRGIDEMTAMIDAQCRTGKVTAARKGSKHRPRAAAHLEHTGRRRNREMRHIVVEQARKHGVLGATFQSGNQALDGSFVELVDESMRITRSHASPHSSPDLTAWPAPDIGGKAPPACRLPKRHGQPQFMRSTTRICKEGTCRSM